MSGAPETPRDDFLESLRAARPEAPAGLSERVLSGVREAALAKLRFREEFERSARGVLMTAAAGLLVCGALLLGQDPATSPTTADGRPTRTPDRVRSTATTDTVDQGESLTLATPPGALEGELTQGLWLFDAAEDE